MSRTFDSPVFVYGTLRAGEALARLLPADTTRYHATTRGTLHYAPSTEGYPVFVPSTDASVVHGDLMWLDLDRGDVAYVVMMELRAGYSCEWRTVLLHGNEDAYIDALVFTWDPDNGLGRHIESGDWCERWPSTEFYCTECGKTYSSTLEALTCEASHDMEDWDAAMSFAIEKDTDY